MVGLRKGYSSCVLENKINRNKSKIGLCKKYVFHFNLRFKVQRLTCDFQNNILCFINDIVCIAQAVGCKCYGALYNRDIKLGLKQLTFAILG